MSCFILKSVSDISSFEPVTSLINNFKCEISILLFSEYLLNHSLNISFTSSITLPFSSNISFLSIFEFKLFFEQLISYIFLFDINPISFNVLPLSILFISISDIELLFSFFFIINLMKSV